MLYISGHNTVMAEYVKDGVLNHKCFYISINAYAKASVYWKGLFVFFFQGTTAGFLIFFGARV